MLVGGSSAINMFSNLKMSEIDPRGGGQHFSNKSEIQKRLKYPMGVGGQAYLGKCPKFSCFLIMRPPLIELLIESVIILYTDIRKPSLALFFCNFSCFFNDH